MVLLAIFGADPQRPLALAVLVAAARDVRRRSVRAARFPLAERIHQGAALSRVSEGLGR